MSAQSPFPMRFAVVSLPAIMITPSMSAASVVLMSSARAASRAEGADRVVILAACPFGEEFPEVPRDAFARDVGCLALAARCDHLQEPRPIGGPALPARLLVLGNPEQAQHHPHRQRLCDLADPLHVPARCRPLDDVVRQRLDRGGESRQFRFRECPCRHLAKPRVLGRVDEQNAVLVGVPRREHACRRVAPARVVGEPVVVSRDAEHVVVPADHPAPQDGASVHRTAASQPRVRGIRVLDCALAQRVVARAVACPLGEAHRECAVAPPSVALRRVRIRSPSVPGSLR